MYRTHEQPNACHNHNLLNVDSKLHTSWKIAHIEAPDDFTQQVLNVSQQSLSLVNVDMSLMRKAGLRNTMFVRADQMKTTITEN